MAKEQKSSLDSYVEGHGEGMRVGQVFAHIRDVTMISKASEEIELLVDSADREKVLKILKKLVGEISSRALDLSGSSIDANPPIKE